MTEMQPITLQVHTTLAPEYPRTPHACLFGLQPEGPCMECPRSFPPTHLPLIQLFQQGAPCAKHSNHQPTPVWALASPPGCPWGRALQDSWLVLTSASPVLPRQCPHQLSCQIPFVQRALGLPSLHPLQLYLSGRHALCAESPRTSPACIQLQPLR